MSLEIAIVVGFLAILLIAAGWISSQRARRKGLEAAARASIDAATASERRPVNVPATTSELEGPLDSSETSELTSSEILVADLKIPKRKAFRFAESSDTHAAVSAGLSATRGGLLGRLKQLFVASKPYDTEAYDELLETLISADVGVKTASKLVESVKERIAASPSSSPGDLWDVLRAEILALLSSNMKPQPEAVGCSVWLVVGVNGAGKTTTIGKLGRRFKDAGHAVLLAAGDTFRAAAVEQLEGWGRRSNIEVVKREPGSDSASVVFDAIKRGHQEEFDLVVADTAGRLHTKSNLMDELKKVVRTAEKAHGRPLDRILLVLDGTMGQNALSQAKIFVESVGVSSIAVTKLDGTAKGGVILAIADELKIPVDYVGLGEKVEDLKEFDPRSFVDGLLGHVRPSA